MMRARGYKGTDKRLFERIPCDFPVEVMDSLTRTLNKAKVYDFSGGGMGLILKRSLPVGEEVSFGVRFAPEFSLLSGKGKVSWLRQEASGWWRIGVTLSPLSLFKLNPLLRYRSVGVS